MNYLTIFGYIVIPLLSLLVIPAIRSYFMNINNRLTTMESHINQKLTEEETRIIINDKLEPVKESLLDIKDKLEKITDYLIKKQ